MKLASYTIADDRRSITCHRCGRTSYNFNDVANLYCGHCHRFHEDGLPIWTIYDHPTDFPDSFVARKFVFGRPTDAILTAPTLDELRRKLADIGLVALTRSPGDDPKIVETWI
jgi:hypothetical protein